jgi:hypothetical protein
MFSLVQKRKWYFLISAILIVPGLLAMIYSLIVFGSPAALVLIQQRPLLELQFEQAVSLGVRAAVAERCLPRGTVQAVRDDRTIAIRSKPMEVADKEALKAKLSDNSARRRIAVRSVGLRGARDGRSGVLAMCQLDLYLIFYRDAFRLCPTLSLRVCAIANAARCDLSYGVVSILGRAAGWEADFRCCDRLPTVVGFSVQD